MSNKTTSYTQCDMKNESSYIHTAWIPKEYARVHKKIKIDSLQGTWTVVMCYETKDASFVEEHSRDYKNAFPSIQEV